MHGSKDMLCTRMRDERTSERTDKPEAICPPTFLQSWEHKKGKLSEAYRYLTQSERQPSDQSPLKSIDKLRKPPFPAEGPESRHEVIQ